MGTEVERGHTMDGAQQDELMRRAQAAHRRAESAIERMFGNFGRYEDDSRASRLVEVALAREQQTWIAAFGSPQLRELSGQAEARDENGHRAKSGRPSLRRVSPARTRSARTFRSKPARARSLPRTPHGASARGRASRSSYRSLRGKHG
jgi:hypothetical protein